MLFIWFFIFLGFLGLETTPVLKLEPTVVSNIMVSSFHLDVEFISICSSSECVSLRFLLDEVIASTESSLLSVRTEKRKFINTFFKGRFIIDFGGREL